jgi:hypothetical protein
MNTAEAQTIAAPPAPQAPAGPTLPAAPNAFSGVTPRSVAAYGSAIACPRPSLPAERSRLRLRCKGMRLAHAIPSPERLRRSVFFAPRPHPSAASLWTPP